MRTQAISLAFAIVAACPFASAQWVHTSLPDSFAVTCFAVSGTNLFAGHGKWGSGVLRSTDSGSSWIPINTSITNDNVHSLAASGKNLFATTNNGVFRSTDNGTTWTPAGTPFGSFSSMVQIGSNLFAGGEGIFLSTDNGTNWTAANNGLPKSHLDSTQYVTITCLVSSGQNLFAGTYESQDSDSGGVFLSTNSGSSWTKMNAGLQVDWGVLGARALAVSGTNLFAGTIRGIFLSTNNGARWIAANPALQNNLVSALAIYGTNIFAGTGYYLKANSPIGVFLSTDNGAGWTAVNEGLPGGPYWYGSEYAGIYCFGSVDQSLFVGTDNGLWRRPLSEMITSVGLPLGQLPAQFSLKQNYPNPFNPSTVISYQLPVVSNVKLAVYDILGREVAVLVNERKDAGSYEVKFDAAAMATGVYFYRIQAGDLVQAKKLVIVK